MEVLLEVAHEKSSVWIDKWNTQNKIVDFKTIEKLDEGCNIFKVKMGEVNIECTWVENQIRTSSPSHIEVTVAIFRHVLNLMKFSKNIKLDLLLDSNEVSVFPVLEGVTATALRGGPFDTTTVEAFCLKYPSQKSIVLVPKRSGGDLNRNSPILKVEEICFHGPEKSIPTILESFSGRVAFFCRAQCPETSIIKFMRTWMTSSIHQSLEVLHFTLDNGFFIYPQMIIKEFETETKTWDPTKRPENYEYDTKTIGLESIEKTINCSNFLDIERYNDGRLASFLVTPSRFEFYVWNINCMN
ncbi:hypothetical protein CAEBREN_08394 [Caenorhabditis brenneri]|uniref:F-box associated domain-containing protein n=1 Tax=Caenorhabditis brenneri TaxID=135651 RepID=G0MLJ6_CAEBE|nr:hypothetical protein CAEBREN_08394 [Caenorhabditis brenneri]